VKPSPSTRSLLMHPWLRKLGTTAVPLVKVSPWRAILIKAR
jgi:hypothetical protein